jgi:hypothetical protein
LGSTFTRWKISTGMLNRFSVHAWTDSLTKYGYVEVDSANAREGDVVIRAKMQGDSSGHAGVFMGFWAAPEIGTAGHPVGWANNGTPATYQRPVDPKPTGKFDFKRKGVYVVFKFFRQLHS